MLKFTVLTEETADDIRAKLLSAMPEADGEYLDEIIESFLEEKCECATSAAFGCLLVRIFDGEYSFVYPIALCDGADETAAVNGIRAYAVKEEIPLTFTDVPSEELGRLLPIFRHATVDAADSEGESYTVRVQSELSAIVEVPRIEISGEVVLDEIQAFDDVEFARLCKDRETNAFWGYDYSLDASDPADSYFREEAEREFAFGTSLSFAIRYKGKFAGEATIYRPDLLGGCDCAVRVLPECRRIGLAGAALSSLIEEARRIGFVKIRAAVMKDNMPSVKMCEKYFDSFSERDEKTIVFLTEL